MSTAFLRVVWKEYRAVRGFWIAVIVLAVLVQIAFVAVISPGGDRVTSVYATALGAAALFVVGCLAAAFAAEREEETLRFLQIVPGTWRPVVGGKLAFAGLSAAALVGVLFATAATMLGGEWPQREYLVDALAVFGVAIVECAAWAALFSLLSRRPLVAAVGAIAAASMATHVAIWFADPGRTQVWSAATYRDAWYTRLALAAGVAVVAGLVSRRWLGGALEAEPRRKQSRLKNLKRQRTMAASAIAVAPPRGKAVPIVGRLVWQTCRQWWWVALLAIVLAGPVVGIIAHMLSLMSETSFVPWWISLAAISGALLGTLVFLSDQEGRQYRFFAERAERPGLVWLARLLFWSTALVLMATFMHVGLTYAITREPVAHAIDTFQEYLQDRSRGAGDAYGWRLNEVNNSLNEAWRSALVVAFSTTVIFSGFCIGQFCSMAVRSGVIAAFIAAITSLVAFGWGSAMVAWQLNGHLMWGLILIPLCLLLATLLRARSWILERKNMRSWMLPANVIMIPLAVVVLSVPAARLDLPLSVWSPYTASSFAQLLEEFEAEREALAQQGQAAADLYFRGCDVVLTWQSFLKEKDLKDLGPDEYEIWTRTDEYLQIRDEWLEQNAKPLALALEAAAHEQCYFPPDILDQGRRFAQFQELQQVVIESGKQYLRKGELGQALDRFLAGARMIDHLRQGQRTWTWHASYSSARAIQQAMATWARAPQQTPAILRRAIAAIEQDLAVLPRVEDSVIADHLHLRAILTGDKDPDAGHVPIDEWRLQIAFIAHQLPWERQRALVVLETLSAERYQTAKSFSDALTKNLPITAYVRDWEYVRESPEVISRQDVPPYSWLETSYFLKPLHERLPGIYSVLYNVAMEEQRQRALLFEMALIAYRLEHGQYPDQPRDLVGDYIRELPDDLFAVQFVGGVGARELSFHYHPQGLDGWLYYGRLIPPGTPLFWSGGISGMHLLIDDQIDRLPLEMDRRGNAVRWQDLEDRPLYHFAEYYDFPEYFETISVHLLPPSEGRGDALPKGRDPENDGVEVMPSIAWSYGSRGYGYGYGRGIFVPGPYAARTYGAASSYSSGSESGNELDGLPPGYDLPSIE